MATEHERAVKLALKTGDNLERLFARILGSVAHPQGRILSAYRQARRALASGALTLGLAAQVLAELRQVLQEATQAGLRQAAEAGTGQARRELAVYQLPDTVAPASTAFAQQAWMAIFVAQTAQIAALVMQGDKKLLLGDDSRVGIFAPAPMLREGSRWLALASQNAYGDTVQSSLQRAGAQDEYMRQLVAAIDERTTDCCLRVHGQAVKMDEPFHLTGTPRYADTLMTPPFHDFCRSSQVLVRKSERDDGLSQRMRVAATREIDARGEDDNRKRISPAHATSGRRRQ